MLRHACSTMALVAFLTAPCWAQSAAPTAMIAVNMQTTDLLVTDMKYRVLFNKREQKAIPLTDFDFAANLQDELHSTLANDKRFQWRPAKAAEKDALAPLFAPATMKAKSLPAPAVEADRVLLVSPSYVAFIHAMRKFIQVGVALRLVDRRTGRVLWKKTLSERTGLPDTLEDMQADNQKVLKETLNKVMDQITPKVRAYVVASKM